MNTALFSIQSCLVTYPEQTLLAKREWLLYLEKESAIKERIQKISSLF